MRFLPRRPKRSSPTYYSRFGGLWTDRLDARQLLARSVERGEIADDLATPIEQLIVDGFAILRGAVDEGDCDRLVTDLDTAWAQGDERVLVVESGTNVRRTVRPSDTWRLVRAVDAYVVFDSARRLLGAPVITRFLASVFGEPPLLFQSLSFGMGSEQGLHRDTAFVVVDPPMSLVAAWIALEDVASGSGELTYVPGSHRLPEYLYSGQFKHWNPGRDGVEQLHDSHRQMADDCERLGLASTTFAARKGDVFFWSADLAHGGAPITDVSLTRRSLVGHYCPISASPHFFSYLPDHRHRRPMPNGAFVSQHYQLPVGGARPA